MERRTSPIWNYFVQIDGSSAKCNICDRLYSRKGRTTTALKNHLKSIHVEKFAEFEKLDQDVRLSLEAKKQEVSLPFAENAKKQQKLQQSMHVNDYWDSSNYKSLQMDRMIAEMIALQNLSFSFVEGTGFRRVMKAALPKYNLRGRDFFSSYLCDDLYNKLAKKIKDILEKFEKISFTSNIWSDLHSEVSLLTLSAHGITEDFRKMSIILNCEVMDKRHTGDGISTQFERLLHEWNINHQAVHCMVCDRGHNMVRAMQLSSFENVNCVIHQIQLCILAGVESQDWLLQLIAKLKKVATHFKHSLVAQAELTKIQKEYLNQSALPVIQDCPTRWNSTFYMMERFSKLKDSLVLYFSANPIVIISPEDWINVHKFVQIMKPFEEITNNLSSSEANISSVIPLIQVLKTTLQNEETKPDTSQQFQNLTRKLRDELNSCTRFGDLNKNYKYTIATYLDPRYKSKFFNEIVTEQIETEILNLITIGARDANTIEYDGNPSSPEMFQIKIENQDQPLISCAPIFEFTRQTSLQTLDSMLSMNEDQLDPIMTYDSDNMLLVLKSKLLAYKNERRLPVNEDPLMWWKLNAHKYHRLLPLVRQYLSAPPSSIASEQLFSGADFKYEEHRLQGVKTAKLLFVKHNLPLLNFEY